MTEVADHCSGGMVEPGDWRDIFQPDFWATRGNGKQVSIEAKTWVPGRWMDIEKFEALDLFPKFFWKSRDGAQQIFALGKIVAGDLRGIRGKLEGTGLRGYGGRAFSPPSCARHSSWQAWPGEFFFVPAFEFHPQRTGTTIFRNRGANEEGTREPLDPRIFEEFSKLLTKTSPRPPPDSSLPVAMARLDTPNFRGWSAQVHSVLGELERDVLQKVVLARRSTLDLVEKVEAFPLLQRLEAANPHCTIFAVAPSREAGVFLGASPECLYKREGDLLQTEAVAGTRIRSLDPTEDLRLESQLLDSAKERHEHAVVVDAIAAAMQRLCGECWQVEPPEILKLARLQHLRSKFSGTLQFFGNDALLLDVLHPTPATCGSPIVAARNFLLSQEPFDRGWFAGPVGMISASSAEFCVAIRSFHLRGSEVDIYAGAGIVEDSEPTREWAELESKIAGPLALFSAV